VSDFDEGFQCLSPHPSLNLRVRPNRVEFVPSMPSSKEPDLSQDEIWKATVERMKAEGDKRFKAEQERMRQLGIIDERGQPTSKELPADMKPGSNTDVAN